MVLQQEIHYFIDNTWPNLFMVLQIIVTYLLMTTIHIDIGFYITYLKKIVISALKISNFTALFQSTSQSKLQLDKYRVVEGNILQ